MTILLIIITVLVKVNSDQCKCFFLLSLFFCFASDICFLFFLFVDRAISIILCDNGNCNYHELSYKYIFIQFNWNNIFLSTRVYAVNAHWSVMFWHFGCNLSSRFTKLTRRLSKKSNLLFFNINIHNDISLCCLPICPKNGESKTQLYSYIS